MYSIETPQGTPSPRKTQELIYQGTQLSLCMNKMSLKRQREDDEEQYENKKTKTLRGGDEGIEEEGVNKTGKGKKKIWARTQNDMKKNDKLKSMIERIKAITPTSAKLQVEQLGSGGCPKTATRDQ